MQLSSTHLSPPPTLQRIFLVFQRHAERVTQPAYLCLNASGSVNSAYLHTSLNPPLLHSFPILQHHIGLNSIVYSLHALNTASCSFIKMI